MRFNWKLVLTVISVVGALSLLLSVGSPQTCRGSGCPQGASCYDYDVDYEAGDKGVSGQQITYFTLEGDLSPWWATCTEYDWSVVLDGVCRVDGSKVWTEFQMSPQWTLVDSCGDWIHDEGMLLYVAKAAQEDEINVKVSTYSYSRQLYWDMYGHFCLESRPTPTPIH